MIALALSVVLFAVPATFSMHANCVLDLETEKVVREAVYNEQPVIYAPDHWSLDRALYVPKSLARVYDNHPEAVLDLLLKIMEGGRPCDSALAAGYAISLQAGPTVGSVCVENFFNENTYDVLDKYWATTPRKHWIAKVRELKKKSHPDK
jgi:hypothetical protein